MKTRNFFRKLASVALGTMILASQSSVLAHECTPASISMGGTGGSNLSEAKENLEIPEVVQGIGDSETSVISQKGLKDVLEHVSQEGRLPQAQAPQGNQEECGNCDKYIPYGIKTGGTAATNLKDAKKNLQIPTVVNNLLGDSRKKVPSQKAVKEAIETALEGLEPGGTFEEWQPNPTWWDIEDIIRNDNSGYTKKYIILLPDSNLTTSFTAANATGFKTSDGATYSGSTTINHTWNAALDKPCNEGYKTRWVMVYYSNSLADTTSITLQIPTETLYMVTDVIKFSASNFSGKRLLQSFKLINNSNLHSSITGISSMFSTCLSLKSIPLFDTSNVTDMSTIFLNCRALKTIPLLNTSNVTNMSSMFVGCYSLETIPLLNTSNVTNMSSMFSNCCSLKSIPLFDTSNVTNMSGMFSNCYLLKTIPLLNTSNVTNMTQMFFQCFSLISIPLLNTSNVTNMNNMMVSCYTLNSIPLLDTSSVTNMNSIFSSCNSLVNVPLIDFSSITSSNLPSFSDPGVALVVANIKNLNLSLSLVSNTTLNKNSLLFTINNLADLTGLTTQTLTLGVTNLAKLTSGEIAVATAKNWTVA